MQVQIKQLALESSTVDDELLIDQTAHAEEIIIAHESQIDSMSTYVAMEGIGLEDRGFLRTLGGNIADNFKMLFAWADGNGAKIRKIRQEIREARQQLNSLKAAAGVQISADVRGGGLLTYLGDRSHHVQNVATLVHLIKADVNETQKVLVPMIHSTGSFTKELVEWIYSKDNDWKWGYDEAVDGCVPIISKFIPKLTAGTKANKVDGFDHNDLRVEDGSQFSELFLGNYAISSSWSDAHESAKHLGSSSEILDTYVQKAGHDFVKVPKHGNKYALAGAVTKAELEALLDAADAYLDAADEAAKSIKSNALPVWKTIAMSNIMGGNLAASVKMTASKNYRALYGAMLRAQNWSMKLQRKSATRNQDIAKHLVSFVKTNVK